MIYCYDDKKEKPYSIEVWRSGYKGLCGYGATQTEALTDHKRLLKTTIDDLQKALNECENENCMIVKVNQSHYDS